MINNGLLYRSRFNRAIYDCRNVILFSNYGDVIGSKEPYDLDVNLFSMPWADRIAWRSGCWASAPAMESVYMLSSIVMTIVAELSAAVSPKFAYVSCARPSALSDMHLMTTNGTS